MIDLQLKDNTQAVKINRALNNEPLQSQPAIYDLLHQKHHTIL